nr:zinc finger BED domain-containing protein RICESLEEPER 2-like [Ipomoea batatas]
MISKLRSVTHAALKESSIFFNLVGISFMMDLGFVVGGAKCLLLSPFLALSSKHRMLRESMIWVLHIALMLSFAFASLKLLLHEYLKGVSEGFELSMCLSVETKRMPMKWRDTKNKMDCEVYLMRHMESYFGEGVGSWECGLTKGDRAELNRLRLHYMKEICTIDVNAHNRSNVAECFSMEAIVIVWS